jgi:NAD(P)H-dependent flavin oxidoreductase YrpB (nitropropane dioxygenase family)
MLDTAFTRLLGCTVPVQQAVLGGISTAELALAVARSGGLGMLSVSTHTPLVELVPFVRSQVGDGRFGVGFFGHWADAVLPQVDLAARHADVVEFFWGRPRPDLVARVHDGGARASWQCGTRAEALEAVAAGCDFVVVQGVEAGGHVRGTLPLLALLAEVMPEVDVPVVAAGGIATGEAMAAALAAGASAVRMGTRLVATVESGAHPEYQRALLAASATDTVLTTAFGVGWPDAPHRVLRSAVVAAEGFEGDVVAQDGDVAYPPFAVNTPSRWMTGTIEACALYCGQGVDAIRSVESAADVVRDIAADAERLLRARS